MFILCGLILEAGENLFRDFCSPFSIPFVFFLSVTLFKKTQPTYGPYPTRTLGPSGFISRGGPAGPPQTLAALAPRRRRLCRAAAALPPLSCCTAAAPLYCARAAPPPPPFAGPPEVVFFLLAPVFFKKPFSFSDGFVRFFSFGFF